MELSQLQAFMLELFPGGQEGNMFFIHLSPQLYPAELLIMLGADNLQDLCPLAKTAVKLWVLHSTRIGRWPLQIRNTDFHLVTYEL
jgi:hypothetical protein